MPSFEMLDSNAPDENNKLVSSVLRSHIGTTDDHNETLWPGVALRHTSVNVLTQLAF